MNALDLIISRLPTPPRKAPTRAGNARAYRAHCPACGGHGMPLSLAETADGRPLIHCFGGCSLLDVLGALRLDVDDVLSNAFIAGSRGNGGPSAWGALASAVDALRQAHEALLLACSHAPDKDNAVDAWLRAHDAMQVVKDMARRAMKEGAK